MKEAATGAGMEQGWKFVQKREKSNNEIATCDFSSRSKLN